MANVKDEILAAKFKGKVITIDEFRYGYAGEISTQAVYYAISKDLIDYVEFGTRSRFIVLTEKTLSYVPNKSPKRTKTTMET